MTPGGHETMPFTFLMRAKHCTKPPKLSQPWQIFFTLSWGICAATATTSSTDTCSADMCSADTISAQRSALDSMYQVVICTCFFSAVLQGLVQLLLVDTQALKRYQRARFTSQLVESGETIHSLMLCLSSTNKLHLLFPWSKVEKELQYSKCCIIILAPFCWLLILGGAVAIAVSLPQGTPLDKDTMHSN